LTSGLKRIRGMYLDHSECLLFAVGIDDGAIAIFGIDKPGRVKSYYLFM
jgi:hypothetical protein